MNNKSYFLNLPSDLPRDARRHVPFRSIIHKPLCLIFVFVFLFSIMFSYVHPVAAIADPVFQPVYDTQFYQLPQFVDPLNTTQTDIFYFTLGSQMVEYAGLSGYQVENPYSDPQSVGEWFKKIGYDLYNDVLESFAIAGAPIISAGKWTYDLFANIAGAANFAGAFNNTSFNDFLSDVQNNGLNIQMDPSVFRSLNQFLAYNSGLYNWQFNSAMLSPLNLSNSLSYKQTSMSAGIQSQYIAAIDNLSYPRVRFNFAGSVNYNAVVAGDFFSVYHNIFANTHNNTCYLCDDNGNIAPFDNTINTVYVYKSGGNISVNTLNISLYFRSINISGYSNIQSLYDAFCNNVITFFDYDVWLSDFIQGLYYGDSWNDKHVWSSTSDLNFSANDDQSTLMPIIDTLLDIKGLISDILEQNELKQPALDNLTDLNGDPLPAAQLQPVSVAVELPESGIAIPNNLFAPLTRDGGYISYLWYMTKPLVQYTSDFVQTMVFDGTEDFDVTGPGAIVFGVISLGLIGGLVVKCLL